MEMTLNFIIHLKKKDHWKTHEYVTQNTEVIKI